MSWLLIGAEITVEGGTGYIALGALVTAVAGAFGMVIKAWYDARKNIRADAMNELSTVLAAVQKERADCRAELAEARVEIEQLSGEIRLMQQSIRHIESHTGLVLPSRMPGLVVADLDGTIKTASPALAPILHFLPQDLIGKNIEIIIPERLRDQHRAALAKVKMLGQPPWPEKTLLTYGLVKEGTEVPVTVRLYGWQAPGGSWLISAEISRRVSSAELAGQATPFPPPQRGT